MVGTAKTNDLKEAFMRHVFLAGALAFVALTPTGAAAERQYPWCARYDWSTYNCGFVSYQQCMATAFGSGGYCEQNPRYSFAAQPRAKKRYQPQ
jgi:uncharacterized protein DUF3551